jgi:hypothetical protein
MELENVSNKLSERKMENGLFSTEIEGNALIKELDFKLMATILSIF